MKKIITFLLFIAICFLSNAQSDKSAYDKQLADSLGADEYGMKIYIFVILKTGDSVITDNNIKAEIFKGHMANIVKLSQIGKMIVAGPMMENDKNFEGIFILNVKTKEEADALLETDPAVHARLLRPEFYTWYGSAALPTYLPNHSKIQKTKF